MGLEGGTIGMKDFKRLNRGCQYARKWQMATNQFLPSGHNAAIFVFGLGVKNCSGRVWAKEWPILNQCWPLDYLAGEYSELVPIRHSCLSTAKCKEFIQS